MSERTPIDLVAVSALSALGALAITFVAWSTVDRWMRSAGRVHA